MGCNCGKKKLTTITGAQLEAMVTQQEPTPEPVLDESSDNPA